MPRSTFEKILFCNKKLSTLVNISSLLKSSKLNGEIILILLLASRYGNSPISSKIMFGSLSFFERLTGM